MTYARRFRVATTSLALIASCKAGTASMPPESQSQTTPFDYDTRVGWVHGNCARFRSGTAVVGHSVSIVLTQEPQSVVSAKILRVATSEDSCPALADDRRTMNADKDAQFVVLDKAIPSAKVGIALLDYAASIAIAHGKAHADLEGNGAGEYFTECATSEGARFAIWHGPREESGRRWSGYYYLGYDTVPTCPPEPSE